MAAEQPIVLVAEGKYGSCHWRQYFVITDERVAVVHMQPALFGGWRFQRVDVQCGEAWAGYSAAAIVRYKTTTSTHAPPADLGSFLPRLLAVAAAGELPDDYTQETP